MPPLGSALFPQSDQALAGVEVLWAQCQRTACAAGGFGVQPDQQHIQFRVVASCRGGTHNPSHKQWCEWISPDIDYLKICPELPISPDDIPAEERKEAVASD
ncbi:hypothetical protein [Nocardia xishanensis]|uniref:Uncharacterized protein n=1 Tax=Nocardia xishanensis TaxID=238964 RepID=A0ABW7XCE8_9NOCA